MVEEVSETMNFDFHIHSIYSHDSFLKPETIIKKVKNRCLTGIAITDHNTIKGALKVKKLADDDFTVIVGSEIKTNKGDVIGLFLSENIKAREFVEVTDEIRDQDGIVILPHPFKNKFLYPKELLTKIDLIEGLNARISKELNYKAQLLSKKYEIPFIAGSDAHTSFEIGQVQTVFSKDNISFESDDIRNYLLNGKFKITGVESPYHLRLLSRGIGKYKKEGLINLLKMNAKKFLS